MQAVYASDNITFRNCKSVSVQTDDVTALYAGSGNVLFENCDNVVVATASSNFAINGNTNFKGCKLASVSTAGVKAILGDYTCDGRLIITENNVTKIVENGKEPVVTGGDVTNTGLYLYDENMPTEETVYVAGNGTITFIPAEEDKNAKLVLNNATIKRIEGGPAIDFADNVDIEINGINEFSAMHGIVSGGTINISGSGQLTVEDANYAIRAEDDVVVNSGTLVLSCQEGIDADKNITVNGGNITVTPSENGYGLYTYVGDITINNGTLNISSEAEDVCGICADGEMDDETGKISGGNVFIHGGTVNIAVEQEAIFAYDKIKIDSYANVTSTSTGDFDGIYASNGTIDINGNAKVTATGGCDGIYVNEGNVSIGDSAEVIATGGEDAIFASEGNITIKDNAKVTAKSDEDVAIVANYGALTISGNAIVTADGAEGDVDVYAEKACNVTYPAKLTALVQTTDGYIAYGICDNNNFTQDMDIDENNTLEVKPGAEFTINAGTAVSIIDSSAMTLEGKLINEGMLDIAITDAGAVPKGKIVNNGALLLAFADDTVDAGAVIRAMELTGTDFVYVRIGSQECTYATDGTKLNSINVINLSDENLNGDLDKDFYHWDKDTKTLTLKDAFVVGLVDNLPDVTIQTEGNVVIGQMQNISGGTITVTGNSATIMFIHNNGDIIFKDITANVYGIGDDDEDNPQPQALNPEDDYSYGVTLINSKITVGGVEGSRICTKKLTMDDTSVLTLKYVQLECYTKDGLDGITAYLPKDGGYKIGQAQDEEFYTILDANGNIVYNITLKKPETTKPSTGGSGSSGGSAVASYDIAVKNSQNGTVTIDRKTASAGSTVTLTVKPNQGWTLETLTVLDANGNKIDLTTVKAGETYTFKMPSGKITVEATFMEDNSILNFFVDVPSDSYFYNAVRWAAEQNVTSGTDDTHFSPAAFCTRAQIVTFLWRAAGSPEPKSSSNPFADVTSGSYYEKAVLWAIENGITNGMDDTHFGPDATCTRAQSVTFLYRTAGSTEVSENAAFSDVASDAYYANAVAWAEQNAVTGGIGDGLFGPNNNCTRAQIVTFLYRMYQDK